MNYPTVSEAVLGAIARCLELGIPVSPRGDRCYELLNFVTTVSFPESGPVISRDPVHNQRMAKYYTAELELYNSLEYLAEEYAKHASLWGKIANPDGTINSAYGKLIFGDRDCRDGYYTPHCDLSQWEWARRSLRNDRDTRQAIVRLNKPEHQWWGNKDFPCTMFLQFVVRQEALNLTAVMRSCDVTRGLPYDVPYFVSLQERMAREIGAQMGTYTHFATSLHLYESEKEKALRMIGAKRV